jgi:hypothetical protein
MRILNIPARNSKTIEPIRQSRPPRRLTYPAGAHDALRRHAEAFERYESAEVLRGSRRAS